MLDGKVVSLLPNSVVPAPGAECEKTNNYISNYL